LKAQPPWSLYFPPDCLSAHDCLCTNGGHNGSRHLASVTKCKTAKAVVKPFVGLSGSVCKFIVFEKNLCKQDGAIIQRLLSVGYNAVWPPINSVQRQKYRLNVVVFEFSYYIKTASPPAALRRSEHILTQQLCGHSPGRAAVRQLLAYSIGRARYESVIGILTKGYAATTITNVLR